MAKKADSDQEYVFKLCDNVIGQIGLREATFDELRGDPGQHGRTRRLPVDCYYPALDLVLEYHEQQHTTEVKIFDKPDRLTVSGVHRGEQRKIYDQRRRDVLPQLGLMLVELSYTEFEVNSALRLKRNSARDTVVIQRKLADFLQ